MQMRSGAAIGIAAALIVLLILVISAVWTVATYNRLVELDESIDGKWAQVENVYQFKIDLIPQLVSTVEGYQEFESSTLSNITALRTRWMDASGDSEEQLDISNQIDSALRSVILTYENYPYLQSIQAVSDLMVSLESVENQIKVERMRYNDEVKELNTKVKQFPSVIIANMFGFDERSYFESDAAPNNPG